MNQPYSASVLRKSAYSLLSGKLLSAALTFTILLVLVRILSIEEYGAYITFLASVELGYAVSQVGLPWVSARYLPEYRLKASVDQTFSFCSRIVRWYLLAVLCLAIFYYMGLSAYLSWLDLTSFNSAALIFLAVLIVEGVARCLRDGLLEPLLQQAAIRSSMVTRQAIFLCGLGLIHALADTSLAYVVLIELVASFFGMAIAYGKLLSVFRNEQFQSETAALSEVNFFKQWKIGLHMYWAYLFSLTYSPQVLINILQRVLGSEATALFGFLRTLNDQVVRYLPATMMFSIIRPKLVATSVAKNSESQVNLMANLAGKLNLLPLLPIILVVFLVGDPLISLLSGGKFLDSGLLLFGFLCLLIPFSQRLLIETVAVTYGKSQLCKKAALFGLIVLPVLWALLNAGLGVWSPIIANGLAYIAFNSIVLSGLIKHTMFAFDLNGYSRLLLAFLISLSIAFILSSITNLGDELYSWPLLLVVLLVIGCYFFLVYLFKVISRGEWYHIKSLAGRAE